MEVNNVLKMVEKKEESMDELKSSLKKQINELKLIISQIEWNLNVTKFGKVKCTFRSDQITKSPNAINIPNIDAQLKYELYRYSGFYCVYYSAQEQVFHFSSSNKCDKKNIYAVQILNNQTKGFLGKWVMPMGIDLDEAVSNFPIDKLKNVPRFLKICKHYIDCYSMRREQYASLMSIVSSTKNCNLQTNIGYTLINLKLTNVYNENDNTIIDIVIYLTYDINETRPHKIQVDSAVEKELDKETRKHLQKCLQQFKSCDLCVTFENELNIKPFVWTKETEEDSLIQINSASESDDDGYLASILLPPKGKKSLRITDPRLMGGAKITKRNTWKKKKYSGKSIPIRNKQLESTSIESNSKRKNGSKLQDNNDKNGTNNDSNNSISLDRAPSVNEKISKWSGIPFTSTPICRKRKGFPNTGILSKVNISDITVSESNSNATGKSELERHQFKKNTSEKQLEKKMKRKIIPSIV